jgi:quinol monooxygenase YgiN
MSETVSWNLQLAVREGQLDAARELMAEMAAATRQESGTLGYEWFLSADGLECHLYERYADSAAALVHVGTFGSTFAERFLGCFTPTALWVYGDPNAEVRGALDGFGAQYLGEMGGFHR